MRSSPRSVRSVRSLRSVRSVLSARSAEPEEAENASYSDDFDATMDSQSEAQLDSSVAEDARRTAAADRRQEIARRQEADAKRTVLASKVSEGSEKSGSVDEEVDEEIPSEDFDALSENSNSFYDPEAKRREEEMEKRQREEEERKRKEQEAAEEQRRRKEVDEANRRLAERKRQEDAQRRAKEEQEQAEQARKKAEEAERERKLAEERQKKAEEERVRKAEEERVRNEAAERARKAKEEEERRKQEEEKVRRMEEEARQKQKEEEERVEKAEQAQQQLEEEDRARRMEEAAKQKQEEEERAKKEQDARQKKLEEEERARKVEDDARQKKQEQELARKAEQEAQQKRQQEEEEHARKVEDDARKAMEEEEEARQTQKQQEEELARRTESHQLRLEEEEQARNAEEARQKQKQQEQELARKAGLEAKQRKREEEEQARKVEDAARRKQNLEDELLRKADREKQAKNLTTDEFGLAVADECHFLRRELQREEDLRRLPVESLADRLPKTDFRPEPERGNRSEEDARYGMKASDRIGSPRRLDLTSPAKAVEEGHGTPGRWAKEEPNSRYKQEEWSWDRWGRWGWSHWGSQDWWGRWEDPWQSEKENLWSSPTGGLWRRWPRDSDPRLHQLQHYTGAGFYPPIALASPFGLGHQLALQDCSTQARPFAGDGYLAFQPPPRPERRLVLEESPLSLHETGQLVQRPGPLETTAQRPEVSERPERPEPEPQEPQEASFEAQLLEALLAVVEEMLQLKYGKTCDAVQLRRQLLRRGAGEQITVQRMVEHLNSQELWADVGHQVRLVLQMRQLSFQELLSRLRRFAGTSCAICVRASAGGVRALAVFRAARGAVCGRGGKRALEHVPEEDFCSAFALEPKILAPAPPLTAEFQSLDEAEEAEEAPVARTSPQLLAALHAPLPSTVVFRQAAKALELDELQVLPELLQRLVAWFRSTDQCLVASAQRSLAEAPGHRALVGAMQRGLSLPELCHLVLQVVGRSCRHHVENAAAFVQAGAAKQVCLVLERHQGHKELQRHGRGASRAGKESNEWGALLDRRRPNAAPLLAPSNKPPSEKPRQQQEGRMCPITGLEGVCPMARKPQLKEGEKPPELKVLMFLMWEEGESKVSVGVYPHQSQHWEALQLPDTTRKEQIKAQYRKLSVKYHPDKNKEEGAKERFQRITEAYEALKDRLRGRLKAARPI
ncbi:unnamed protein product [Effrenium voratum]|uniref:J domain-containing protein n=1 Tax=Effrenium voratum TaxID=2562239 RepID=A0AA36JKV2_9DINO|nr:unnamed protein product [Effrenium voratum]